MSDFVERDEFRDENGKIHAKIEKLVEDRSEDRLSVQDKLKDMGTTVKLLTTNLNNFMDSESQGLSKKQAAGWVTVILAVLELLKWWFVRG